MEKEILGISFNLCRLFLCHLMKKWVTEVIQTSGILIFNITIEPMKSPRIHVFDIKVRQMTFLFSNVNLNVILHAWACNFIKKDTLTQVFSCEFCEIFRSTFFTENLRGLLLDFVTTILTSFFTFFWKVLFLFQQST